MAVPQSKRDFFASFDRVFAAQGEAITRCSPRSADRKRRRKDEVVVHAAPGRQASRAVTEAPEAVDAARAGEPRELGSSPPVSAQVQVIAPAPVPAATNVTHVAAQTEPIEASEASSAKSIRLFEGKTFYFFREGRRTARRLSQYQVVKELGGIVIETFPITRNVTRPSSPHEVVQPTGNAGKSKVDRETIDRLDYMVVDDYYNRTSLELDLQRCGGSIPAGTLFVKGDWVAECARRGRVLPIEDAFAVEGLEPPIDPIGAASPSHGGLGDELENSPEARTLEEEPSLVVRPRPADGGRKTSTEASTRGPSAADPSAAAVVGHRPAQSQTTSPNTPALLKEESDALDKIAREAHLMDDIDAEDGAGVDEEHQGSADLYRTIHESASGSVPSLQKHFKCAKAHPQGADKETGPNDVLIAKLESMRDFYELSKLPDDRWRLYGYGKAVAELKKCTEPVQTYEQARALRFVGDRIAQHIVTIANGIAWREEMLSDPSWLTMKLFLEVHGVGPICARRWVEKGIRTIDEAKQRGKPDARQCIGLDLYDDFLKRIPRDEVTAHGDRVAAAAKAIHPELECHIVGSYRRGARDCGDIDVLVTRPGLRESRDIVHVWRALRASLDGFITHDLVDLAEIESQREGSHSLKWLGVSRLPTEGAVHRRLDILIVPHAELGSALLYFTGNALFNRSMRLLARRTGAKLSDKGLFVNVARDGHGNPISDGVRVAGETERGIFDKLQIKWREPKDRCVQV